MSERMRPAIFFAALGPVLFVGAAGCIKSFGLSPETSPGVEAEVAQADREAHESRTLSHMATLEISINDYIKAESKIPNNLEDLIPKYIAEIPSVELGLTDRHKDNSEVEYYPTGVLRDGVVDGTRIKDTGRWGYVRNDHQIVIFVDCIHKSSRGKVWYQERGVF